MGRTIGRMKVSFALKATTALLVFAAVASCNMLRTSEGGGGARAYLTTKLAKEFTASCYKYKDDSTCAPCVAFGEGVIEEDFSGMRAECLDKFQANPSLSEEENRVLAKNRVVCHQISDSIAPSGSTPMITATGDKIPGNKHRNAKIRTRNNKNLRSTLISLAQEQKLLAASASASTADEMKELIRQAVAKNAKKRDAGGNSIFYDFCLEMRCCGDKGDAPEEANNVIFAPDENEKNEPLLMEEARRREEEHRRLKEAQDEQDRAAKAKREAELQKKLEIERLEREAEAERARMEKEQEEEAERLRREAEDAAAAEDAEARRLLEERRRKEQEEEAERLEQERQRLEEGEAELRKLEEERNRLLEDDSGLEQEEAGCPMVALEEGLPPLSKTIAGIPNEDISATATIVQILKDVGRLFNCIMSENYVVAIKDEDKFGLSSLVYQPPDEDDAEDDDDVDMSPVYVQGVYDAVAAIQKASGAVFNQDRKKNKFCERTYSQLTSNDGVSALAVANEALVRYDAFLAKHPTAHRKVYDSLMTNVASLSRSIEGALKGRITKDSDCSRVNSALYSALSVPLAQRKIALVRNLAAELKRTMNSKKSKAAVPEGSSLVFDVSTVSTQELRSDMSAMEIANAAEENFTVLRRVLFLVKAALVLISEERGRVAYVMFMEKKIEALFSVEPLVSKALEEGKTSGDMAKFLQLYRTMVKVLVTGSRNTEVAASGASSSKDTMVLVWDAGSTKSAVNMVLASSQEGVAPSAIIKRGASWPEDAVARAAPVSERERRLESARTYEDLASTCMGIKSDGLPHEVGQLENTLNHDFVLSERGMYSMPGLSSFLDCDRGCPENYMNNPNMNGPKWKKQHDLSNKRMYYVPDKRFKSVPFPKWLMEDFCPRPRCPEQEEFMAKSLGMPSTYKSSCISMVRRENADAEKDTKKRLVEQCMNDQVAAHSRLHLPPKSATYKLLVAALTGKRKIGSTEVCDTYALSPKKEYNLMNLKGYVAMMLNILGTKSALAKEAEGTMGAKEKVLVVSTAGMRIGQAYCPHRTVEKIREFESYIEELRPRNMESGGYSMQNGKLEALNGWITANFLAKTIAASGLETKSISHLPKADLPSLIPTADDLTPNSAVHIELGGGSVQIAFTVPSMDDVRDAMVEYDKEYLVDGDTETEIPLYRFSLLYYGAEYAKYTHENWANTHPTSCFQPGLAASEQATAFRSLYSTFKQRMSDSDCEDKCNSLPTFRMLDKSDAHCCLLPTGSVRQGSAERQKNVDTATLDSAERFQKCFKEISTNVVAECAKTNVPDKEYNRVSDVKVKPTMITTGPDGEKKQRDVMVAGGGMYYPMQALIRIMLCSNLVAEGAESPWAEFEDAGMFEKACLSRSDVDATDPEKTRVKATKAAVRTLLGDEASVTSEGMDADIKELISDYVNNLLSMRKELGKYADRLEDFTNPILSVKLATMKKLTELFCGSNVLYSAAYRLGGSAFNAQLSSVCFSNTFNLYMFHNVFGIRFKDVSAEVNTDDLLAEEDPVASLAENNAVVRFTMGVLRQYDENEGPKWYPNRWSIGAAARYMSAMPEARENALAIEAIGDPESDKTKALMEKRIDYKIDAFKDEFSSEDVQRAVGGKEYHTVLDKWHTPAGLEDSLNRSQSSDDIPDDVSDAGSDVGSVASVRSTRSGAGQRGSTRGGRGNL